MPENDAERKSVPPMVVLVHGAWHGAWCWAALQAELDRHGVASIAIDLPGHGASTLPLSDMYGDARHVADVVKQVGRPVVLVGHSYGGAVITEAAHILGGSDNSGLHPVEHLLYLAAFCLDEGETVMSIATSPVGGPVLLGQAMLPGPEGTTVLDPDKAHAALYASCSPEISAAAVARLSPQPMVTFGQPVTGAPWKDIPSTYVVCERDEAVHPGHQRRMAARCGHVHVFDTDHSPFVSATNDVARIITDAMQGGSK
jgi:pimeloyl-ACP methyl ester carboxylesterase